MTSFVDTSARRRTGSPPIQLMLRIGLTVYEVHLLGGLDPRPGSRGFRLTKPDGTHYDIDTNEPCPRCDCPDFIFRRDGLDPAGCKHIRALGRTGLLRPSRA